MNELGFITEITDELLMELTAVANKHAARVRLRLSEPETGFFALADTYRATEEQTQAMLTDWRAMGWQISRKGEACPRLRMGMTQVERLAKSSKIPPVGDAAISLLERRHPDEAWIARLLLNPSTNERPADLQICDNSAANKILIDVVQHIARWPRAAQERVLRDAPLLLTQLRSVRAAALSGGQAANAAVAPIAGIIVLALGCKA